MVFQPLSALLPEVHDVLNVTYSPALSPEQEQFRLWEAVRELLIIISTSTPLLIALDDLHWSDSSSCELLAYLVRRMRGLPIAIVGTCRDNELGPHHPLRTLLTDLQREHAVECVSLERLSDEQIISLISQVPHIPEPLVPRISSRAAGNPFFAEELAHTVGSPSSSTVTSELTGDDMLPDTITSVLDLRLGRLSNACQRLLSKAAVLGSAFEFNVICAMEAHTDGSNEEAVLDLLEEALKSGMLTEEGTGTRVTYHFWHPLLVTHFYEGLSAARRASLHRRTAEVLRQLYHSREAEGAAFITRHLVQGGADVQQIDHYAAMAGDRAFGLSAYAEAARYYLLVRQEHRSIEMLERLGDCAKILGNYGLYLSCYKKASAFQEQVLATSNDPSEAVALALLLIRVGYAYYDDAHYQEAAQSYDRAEQFLREQRIEGGVGWGSLRMEQAHLAWSQGDFAKGRYQAQEALSLFEQATIHSSQERSLLSRVRRTLAGDPLDVGRCHRVLGLIANAASNSQEALQHLSQARDIAEQCGARREMANSLNDIGDFHLRTAEHRQAMEKFQQALALAETVSDHPLRLFIILNQGVITQRQCDFEATAKLFQQGLTLAENLDDKWGKGIGATFYAMFLQDQGHWDKSAPYLLQVNEILQGMDSPLLHGAHYIGEGRYQIFQALAKHPDQQNEEFQAGMRLIEEGLALPVEAEIRCEGLLFLARVAYFFGDQDMEQLARNVVQTAQHAELVWLHARASWLLADVLVALGREQETEPHYAFATQVFRANGLDDCSEAAMIHLKLSNPEH